MQREGAGLGKGDNRTRPAHQRATTTRADGPETSHISANECFRSPRSPQRKSWPYMYERPRSYTQNTSSRRHRAVPATGQVQAAGKRRGQIPFLQAIILRTDIQTMN